MDLSAPERRALAAWAWSRVATGVVVAVGGLLLAGSGATPDWLARWRRWDVVHYQAIATGGYDQPGPTPYAAFFPGLPLVLRALSGLGIDLTLAGLLVSAVAGATAVVALVRLATDEGPAGAGDRAALALMLSPAAVFLAAGYSEALFLGLALPAWLAAREGRWWSAAVFAGAASSVRVTGLFLLVALAVDWATRDDGLRHDRRAVAPLLLAWLPVAAFASHLRHVEGSWFAFVSAQRRGWDRSLTDPVTTWTRTWDAAFGDGRAVGDQLVFRAELVAVLVGLALVTWLVVVRRWGEAVYVGLQLAALGTSTWYMSVPRATLLWWPLWLLLGRVALRHPWAVPAYLAVVAPVSALWAVAFTTGRWAG